jgi:uncharacterized protein involved in exopolysaccharide biosynthesis
MANFDIAFYLSLLRRRLPIFLLILVAVAGIGTLVTYALPSVYRATAKILVESPQIPTDLARSTVPTGAVEQFQIIQEDVLSRQNLVALAQRFKVYGANRPPSDADIAADMQARITVEPLRVDVSGGDAATIYQISFDASDPNLAAAVTNDLVDMILRKDIELRTSRADDTVKFFTREVARLDAGIKDLDDQIVQYRNAHLNALGDSLDYRRNQLSALQQRQLLLAQEQATLQARQTALQSRRFVVGDTSMTPEEKSLADARQALVEQQAVFSEDSPTIKTLRARIAALENQVRTSGTISADSGANAVPTDGDIELASIKNRLKAIHDEEATIAKSSEALNASILATPGNDAGLSPLQRDHQNLQAQYDAAVARLAEASTGQQIELRLKGQRLTLIESATPPQSAVSPKRKVLLGGSLALALALGLAAIIVPEFFNKSIRRPVELVEKMNIRPLVTIPYIVTQRERHRKRWASLAVVTAAVGIIPLVLIGLHYYGAGPDALQGKPVGNVSVANAGQTGE